MSQLVRHAMSEDVKTLSEEMTAADAAGVMANFDVGSVPVTDGKGRLTGIVTDRDIVVRVIAARRHPAVVSLREIATRDPFEISPDAELADASRSMADHRVRRLPVTKGDELVGIISLGDIAEGLSSRRAVGDALAQVSLSARTAAEHAGPDRGTPDRVADRRERREMTTAPGGGGAP